MRWLPTKVLAFICLAVLSQACQKTSSDSTTDAGANATSNALNSERLSASPFATKEPEKYTAKIFFASQLAENAVNYLEQTYFVARDGDNRRLDFELGGTTISHLQLANGKQFVLLPKQKVYTELEAPAEKLLTNQPAEFSLEHLLNTKPAGATFQRVGVEDVAGRQTVKYKLDYGATRQSENVRTETTVWADENLGLPIKTEVVAIENNVPSGAKSVMELREIKNEVEPIVFEVPKDFRKISYQEVKQIMKR